MIRSIFILASFISSCCVAEQLPSNASLAPYKKNVAQKNVSGNQFAVNISSAYTIPEITYLYLDTVFSDFYQNLSFNTSITSSTFEKSVHYELVAIPLIPTNKEGLQLELFGHFSNPYSYYLSNFSADHLLYNYRANSEEFDIYNSELSLGTGFSFNTSPYSKFKIVISNNAIPGYGTSFALFGFETQF
ncbi:hypothetical protein [Psychromonas sp.]|uniref:hypothetical protein n=1 Tax=Psychromonas sp. TaxID=1884585 RepID=UPI003563897D